MTSELTIHPDAPRVGTVLPRHYAGCFACGDLEGGLRMRFRVVEPLTVESVVTLDTHHQGAPGLAHGGVIAAVFDEALGALQAFVQEPAVTAHLGVDYRRPVPIGTPVHVLSRLDARDGRKLRVSAEAHLGAVDGPVAATATGLFVVVPVEHFTRHGRPEDVTAAREAGVSPHPFARER